MQGVEFTGKKETATVKDILLGRTRNSVPSDDSDNFGNMRDLMARQSQSPAFKD